MPPKRMRSLSLDTWSTALVPAEVVMLATAWASRALLLCGVLSPVSTASSTIADPANTTTSAGTARSELLPASLPMEMTSPGSTSAPGHLVHSPHLRSPIH